MKYLFLVLILAAVQPLPPLPRQTVNEQTEKPGTKHDVSQKPNKAAEPVAAPGIPAANNQTTYEFHNEAAKTDTKSGDQPASWARSDVLTAIYDALTGILVLIGGVGVRFGLRTLRAVESQADIMREQLTAMQGQLAQMEAAGKQTDRLIEKAGEQIEEMAQQRSVMTGQLEALRDQIKAMRDQEWTMRRSVAVATADVEAGINEKRARIKIMVNDINLTSQELGINMAVCRLKNYGQTVGFIDSFEARLVHVPEENIKPDFSKCRQILYGVSLQADATTDDFRGVLIEPNDGRLTDEQLMSIKKGESFVHFYGLVRYRNVYERDRIQTIHIRWTMRWGGMMEGQVMQWWSLVGEPEENQDYEANPN